jgi:predicted transcriptional regulator
MATITINVDDEVEKKFRETAKTVIGDRKGFLGRAVTEAMELWIREKTQKEIARTALELMSQEYHLGKRLYSGRKDLHERT